MSKPTTELKNPHRISVSLTEEQYDHLVSIAEQKRVSLAWVIRDTVNKMIEAEYPLFNQSNTNR